ncbi:hypothetical protein ACFLUY_02760 [Chloroflexota bacterium]
MEVIERMAGGEKRARVIFYVLILMAICLALKPIWDSVDYVATKLSFASPLVNALASVILLLVGFGVMFAVLTLIASFPAQLLRSIPDSAFRIRLNDTFVALIDLLRKAEQGHSILRTKHLIFSSSSTINIVFRLLVISVFFRGFLR